MKNAIKYDDLPYRSGVGIVLFNHEGQVWYGKRQWQHVPEHGRPDYLWQWPQGGIDRGEGLLIAAKRELYEETSVRSVRLLGHIPYWLNYDLEPEMLGIALRGLYRGQTQRWFAFRFEGSDEEINIDSPAGGYQKAEFSEWRWGAIADAPDLVAPFKRDVYRSVVNAFKVLVDSARS